MYSTSKTLYAEQYFRAIHDGTNHKYGNEPYFNSHVLDTVAYAQKYLYLIRDKQKEDVICAQYGHDSIEDCRLTWNDVRKEFGESVANIIFGVTNEKGKTRSDRANDKHYMEMRMDPRCVFCKLNDRLANVFRSTQNGHGMADGYKREYPKFKKSLFIPGEYDEMWEELEQMLFPEDVSK